jgi:hypothetical protein
MTLSIRVFELTGFPIGFVTRISLRRLMDDVLEFSAIYNSCRLLFASLPFGAYVALYLHRVSFESLRNCSVSVIDISQYLHRLACRNH